MFKKEKLQEFMEKEKLSWARLGEQIGTSGTMVGYLLKGYKQPSVVLLRRIADVMGCTMDELVLKEEE